MDLKPKVSKNTREDRELVAAAKRGEPQAFETLLKKYRKSVYYMLLKMVKNADDAEDLTQEAFAKAFNSIEKFDSKYAFSTWLFRIATNNCIDFIRKKRVQTVSIDQPVEGDDGSNMKFDVRDEDLDPNEHMLKQQRKKYLNMAIKRLPEKYRILVELRYFQELSYEEVAQELEIPLGTVKAQLFRARELLNQELKNLKSQM
ncbi:MAG: sigma-70 family RNA polymerase sigma factor [Bacteroidetes bacterium]|nr:sigma-70 family RNA polymerase sigma factor [Bacteroidota bacterium]MCB0846901.1 sigma-70 family RNA polymerase sigma factor [Bacteroidota bacterium]MCB0854890.1 sigma-70 family RNA polymerase sigma factor [Bacteroidota bacterium]